MYNLLWNNVNNVVLQNEHKSFVSGHKQRRESHSKASTALKRTKKKGRAKTSDKQIKVRTHILPYHIYSYFSILKILIIRVN